ncbi:MAG: response regulator [Candidatus Wildermuthbacteria bacterium]|nr:response regulator [Candidatus Wildermuthbacteria bacterium]
MKTILFIEDESALQKTLGDVLKQEGFAVISALDGEKGIQMAKEGSPDLILLDLMLPKQNGFDVLKSLKADEKTKDIPVIVLTNLEAMEDIQKVLELGATTYLVKASYSVEEVVQKAKHALNLAE